MEKSSKAEQSLVVTIDAHCASFGQGATQDGRQELSEECLTVLVQGGRNAA